MLKSRKLWIIIAGVLLAVVLLGLWAKHDADAKAANFVNKNTSLQSTYKTDVAKIKLSSLIDTSDQGKEDATKQKQVCSLADSLMKKLDSFGSQGLASSPGSFMSSQYAQARTNLQDSAKARAQASKILASYSQKCRYFTASTQASNDYEAIVNSKEYRSQLTFNATTCPDSRGGCISAAQYDSFAKVYEKLVKVYQRYKDFYDQTACPFQSAPQQALCTDIKKYAAVSVANSEQYVAALKQHSRSKLNAAAHSPDPSRAYEQMKSTVKKLDPTAKSIDDYWRKLFIAEERQLQQMQV